MEKNNLFIGIFCYLIIYIPLQISSIIISQYNWFCNNADLMGLKVSNYLLGLGLSGLISNLLILLVLGVCYSKIAEIMILIIVILNILFDISWFIVGAIILFRSNIECINTGYALIL